MDQLIVSRQKMAEALSLVCKATAGRVVPLLQCVLLTIRENNLILRATNLDLTIIKSIKLPFPIDNDAQEKNRLLPGQIVLSLITKSKEDKITFAWGHDDNGDTVDVQLGSHRSQFRNIPLASEFPVMPVIDAQGVIISGMDLERLFGLVLPYAAHEVPETAFNGLLFQVRDGQVSATGTDRRRIALVKLNQEAITIYKPTSCIINKLGLKAILSFIENDRVEISINSNFVSFIGSDWQAISRRIEGEYPDIEHILPQEHSLQLECEKESLLHALKLCSQVSEQERPVDIHIGDQLSIQNRGIYGEAFQPFDGRINEGTNLLEKQLDVIRMDWQYLYETVRQIPSRYVILETAGYARPVMVYGSTQLANWDERYLLMPMRRDEAEPPKEKTEGNQGESQEQSCEDSRDVPEMEYVCGNCEYFESDLCLGNDPRPDESCCERFHVRSAPRGSIFKPFVRWLQSIPDRFRPRKTEEDPVPQESDEDEHYCGECARFTTDGCPYSSESEESGACEMFTEQNEPVSADV